MSKKINIERVVGDTYPVAIEAKIDGSFTDLNGYDLYMYYVEKQENIADKKIRIKGVLDKFKKQTVRFYARERYCHDVTDSGNIVSYDGFKIAGEFDYDIFKEKFFYYVDDSGDFVKINNEYVSYDSGNPAHNELTRYVKEKEKITIQHGTISVKSTASSL